MQCQTTTCVKEKTRLCAIYSVFPLVFVHCTTFAVIEQEPLFPRHNMTARTLLVPCTDATSLREMGLFWAFGKVLQRLKLPLLKKMYTVQRVMKDHVYSWGCPVNSCTGNSAFYGEKNQKMLGRSTTSGQQDLFAFAERNTRGLR